MMRDYLLASQTEGDWPYIHRCMSGWIEPPDYVRLKRKYDRQSVFSLAVSRQVTRRVEVHGSCYYLHVSSAMSELEL